MHSDDWSPRDHLNGNVKEIDIILTYDFAQYTNLFPCRKIVSK